MSGATDWLLIEAVLYALWAPSDGDQTAKPEVIDDGFEHLTVNDVIRAQRALDRLRPADYLLRHE